MNVKNDRKEKVTGIVAISISAVLWGLDGVVLTPRLFNLPVGLVVFLLHFIPFLLMNFFMFRQYRFLSRFTGSDYLTMSLIAFTGGALGTICIVKALFLVNFENLTVVVLLQKLQPVFAIALASVVLKEKIKGAYAIWAVLAIVAGYFMTFGLEKPNLSTGSETVYAALLAFLAAFAFGCSTVLSKKMLEKYDFRTTTFYRYLFTTLLMLVYISITGDVDQITDVNKDNWLIITIITLTTGSGAIFLFYFGLRKVEAMLSAIAELFFPVSVIVFDYTINGVYLSVVQWIAIVALLCSIIMLNIDNRRSMLRK